MDILFETKILIGIIFLMGFRRAKYLYKLETDYIYRTGIKRRPFNAQYFQIRENGDLVINARYAWDGCSYKLKWYDLFTLGTPDGKLRNGKPITYYASLVHDALCQYNRTCGISRKEADNIFYELLKHERFMLRWPYYVAVRIFGVLTGSKGAWS